eukprot:422779-Pelagomonas_calceolata.AAC.1
MHTCWLLACALAFGMYAGVLAYGTDAYNQNLSGPSAYVPHPQTGHAHLTCTGPMLTLTLTLNWRAQSPCSPSP